MHQRGLCGFAVIGSFCPTHRMWNHVLLQRGGKWCVCLLYCTIAQGWILSLVRKFPWWILGCQILEGQLLISLFKCSCNKWIKLHVLPKLRDGADREDTIWEKILAITFSAAKVGIWLSHYVYAPFFTCRAASLKHGRSWTWEWKLHILLRLKSGRFKMQSVPEGGKECYIS